MKARRFRIAFLRIIAISLLGGLSAIALAALLTLVLSVAVCLGLHPEAGTSAEWAAAVAGVVWVAAILRRWGLAASVGSGVVTGLLWMFTWLYMIGRFDTHVWASEAWPTVRADHVISWICAPVLGLIAGMVAGRLMHTRRTFRLIANVLPALFVVLIAVTNLMLVETPETRTTGSLTLTTSAPVRDGTVSRLFTFDLSDPSRHVGLYDCDSDDSHPFDDLNTSYFGTPVEDVLSKEWRSGPVAAWNAGFFMWTKRGHIGSHVAPVVEHRDMRYNVFKGGDIWTFTCGYPRGREFGLIHGLPVKDAARSFGTAIAHVRPLIVDGKLQELKPGAGVTLLKCSRTSIAWSKDSKKLYLLIVRDPDGETDSIAQMKSGRRQTGGWDLPDLQRFWSKMNIPNAIALDGGDSTQVAYGNSSVNSGRMSTTLGYWRDRPLRIWIPILPTRYNKAGVMNYLCVYEGSRPEI